MWAPRSRLDSHDFPVVSNDALQLVIVKALGVFFGQRVHGHQRVLPAHVPADGDHRVRGLRRLLHVPGSPALIAAVLFATAPYHFIKGEVHLFFASYYLVPVSCLLVLAVMAGAPLFPAARRRPASAQVGTWRRARRAHAVRAIAAASIYYAVFTALLVAAAAAMRAIARAGSGRRRLAW